jgi:RecG-like helicase
MKIAMLARNPNLYSHVRLCEAARERLELLERCLDGFALAEEDLRQRGMGALAGIHQSGLNLEGFGSGIGLDDDGIDLLLAARRVGTKTTASSKV